MEKYYEELTLEKGMIFESTCDDRYEWKLYPRDDIGEGGEYWSRGEKIMILETKISTRGTIKVLTPSGTFGWIENNILSRENDCKLVLR